MRLGDIDGDTVLNGEDNCPLVANVARGMMTPDWVMGVITAWLCPIRRSKTVIRMVSVMSVIIVSTE